jgi:hypothetical protein
MLEGSVGAVPEQPEYATVHRAEAITARSSLELLALRYPFSQLRLLRVSELAALAEQRRSRTAQHVPSVEALVLEELHRCGVLVPLFRVDPVPGRDAQRIDLSTSLTAQYVHTNPIAELLRGAAEGRVRDPAAEEFAPWPKDHSGALWPSVESGYLYSRHQILGLNVAMDFVSKLESLLIDGKVIWRLGEESVPNAPTHEALDSWRSLAIVLSALDTYYWPWVTRGLRGDPAVWRTAVEAFDPAEMLNWLGLSLDLIDRQATSLRAIASLYDDTGDFYELIRRAKAEAWESLRGDAAVTMDYRLAADILDRYAEELNPGSGYTAQQAIPLSQQGLGARPESLDAALTGLRLSPFPSLVVGVEGATEFNIVPRVMKLLGIQWDRNRIEIIDFGGTDKDLSLLARYAGEPVLGRDLGRGVVLDRPLTRFLVMTDAENKYTRPEDRRYQRRLLLDSLTQNVPRDLQADYYIDTRRGRIVDIWTWGRRRPFEFANFTDQELADAMLAIATVPYPNGRARLIRGLNMQRTRSNAPNVEQVFWPNSRLKKTTLADALWPVLQRKINKAIQHGQKGPPVMQACLRAYEMLTVSEGQPIILRRRRSRRGKIVRPP